ncbi:hypothetical protein V8F06_009156 [Rhypophila decipiens]
MSGGLRCPQSWGWLSPPKAHIETEDGGIIIEQLGDLDVKKPSAASLARRRPAYWNSLERYRQIQAASSSLYGTFAFQWSCAAHQQHMAIIALKSDGPLSLKQAEKFNTIRFDAVITPINAQSSPLCLEIEHVGITLNNQAGVPANHTMTAEAKPDTSLSDMVGTLQTHSQRIVVDLVAERTPNKLKKRTPSSDPAPPKKKTVQFRPMSILSRETAPLSRTTEDDVLAVVEPPPLRNLSRIEEFCQHFDANRSMCSSVCIGYLRNTGIYRFYPPATPRAAISTRQKNLYEVMSEISNGQISRMLPRTAAFHIARELACAVLQYRSTPWLPEVWHRSQVHLFDIDEVLRDPDSLHLPSPYFGAAFSNKQAPGQGPSVVVQYGIIKDLADARLSRNQMLFCLGIILLELGYGKTWPELRDSVAHKKPGQSMYQTAMSLSGSGDLVKKMGHEYPLVVQKCLGCGFARGDDLESEALQGAFLVDLVNVLWEQERILVEAHMKIFGAQESTPQTT